MLHGNTAVGVPAGILLQGFVGCVHDAETDEEEVNVGAETELPSASRLLLRL